MEFTLGRARMTALPSGGLWWAGQRLLCVSDLHLGKSERMARRAGPLLPPYEVAETLTRLEADIARCNPAVVICLGDSFDDLAAGAALDISAQMRLAVLQAGRQWIWIEGNHDAGPLDLGGSHRAEYRCAGVVFRHIAVGAPLDRTAMAGDSRGATSPAASKDKGADTDTDTTASTGSAASPARSTDPSSDSSTAPSTAPDAIPVASAAFSPAITLPLSSPAIPTGTAPDQPEVSGHYHPKARLAGQRLPAFLLDDLRLILPAYGAYTGGMDADRPPLSALMGPSARALVIHTGRLLAIPLPRR